MLRLHPQRDSHRHRVAEELDVGAGEMTLAVRVVVYHDEEIALAAKKDIRVCEAMAKRGVLTRPIGNVIVIMPPYCTTPEQAQRMITVLREGITRL